MAREFRLPDIGEGLTEAEIVRWLVSEGETVAADQPIVEIETDKAVVEIPSPYAGVVLELGGPEGATIAVGEVLVVIGDPEEVASKPADEMAAPMPSAEAMTSLEEAEPIVGTLSDEPESLTESSTAVTDETPRVKALPIVRKMARERGIDLTQVRGTGPGGRITRQDIEALVATPRSEATVASPRSEATVASPRSEATLGEVAPEGAREVAPEGPREVPVEAAHAVREVAVGAGHGVSDEDMLPEAAPMRHHGEERRSLSRLRRTIAANMSRSWSEIPHVTTFDDIDATRFLEVRDALTERHGVKIPVEALVIKAVIPALEEFPEFNATLDGDDLIVHHRHDIGIAVDTPDGLLVAVVKEADAKGVLELAEEVRHLGEGARARSLSPGDLTGQTFTISNIGAAGGGHGTPIVPHGTTAILSVGRARPRPIVYLGDVAIAPVMPLSLSYDHRVIDGAQGRRFMAMVMENLEEPALFLAG